MFEMLTISPPSGVPGGDTLIGEYTRPDGGHTGYYGRVPQSEFITIPDLISKANVPSSVPGSIIAGANGSWLKMTIDGKTLFIFQTQITGYTPWSAFNAAGLIFGQKVIVVGGESYKVRSLTGLGVPSGTTAQTANSEWNRLIYNLTGTTVSGQEGDNWDTFTNAELGMDQGVGSFNLTQSSDSTSPGYVIMRGFNNPTMVGTAFQDQSTTYAYQGFRPVLELI